MDDLIAFVSARLDEDEQVARAAERYWHGVRIESATEAEEDHVRRWDPARVLAEVEADRRILEEAVRLISYDGQFQFLELLALPYASHPDYRGEWRPV